MEINQNPITQPPASRPTLTAELSLKDASVRNAGFDTLRTSLTLLVVMHHTAITYGAIGGWFYREVASNSSLSFMLLVFFCTANQAYFMGLFFYWLATSRQQRWPVTERAATPLSA